MCVYVPDLEKAARSILTNSINNVNAIFAYALVSVVIAGAAATAYQFRHMSRRVSVYTCVYVYMYVSKYVHGCSDSVWNLSMKRLFVFSGKLIINELISSLSVS